MVVFIHVSSIPVSQLQKDSLQYLGVMLPWRLSAFVVQGFIFLSGLKFFMKGTEKFNYLPFLKKRIKTILLPYIIWTAAYYVYYCSIGYFPFDIKVLCGYILNGSIVSPFYFIIAIFQFYLLMPLWICIFKAVDKRIVLVLSFVIMVLAKKYLPLVFPNFAYHDRIFTTYIFYWILGCYAGLDYGKFKNFAIKYIPVESVVFVVLALTDGILSYNVFAKGFVFNQLENLHLLYCISAIMFLFGLFSILCKNGFNMNKILKNIDSSSFYIYLSHCFVMNIVNRKMTQIGMTSIGKMYIVRILSVYIITSVLCILYLNIKKKFIKRR